MSIPNLPTDNLYKFVAIFGLILFISVTAVYLTAIPRIFQKTTDLEVIRQGIINDNIILQKDYSELISNNKSNDRDVLNKIIEIKNKDVEYWRVNSLINNANQEFNNYKKVYISSFIFSILLIIIGFVLWYDKLQKYQDEIIKHESLKTKKVDNSDSNNGNES